MQDKINILIVGCGDLGSVVASACSAAGHNVTGVSRSAKPITSVKMLKADVTNPDTLDALRRVNPNVLIYCVAASGRTDAQYKAQYVDGLRNVLATQQNNQQLTAVIFISSTRVYGQTGDDLLDESVTAQPQDFGGERLLEAEQLLDVLDCETTVLRLSGIYGPDRLRMIQLAQAPERWPSENGWTNRIHRDDAARFIQHLIAMHVNQQPLLPCYIVTDAKPCKLYDVLHWLAAQMDIQYTISTPVEGGGKRLSNNAMLETHFALQYSDYTAGYQTLLAS